MPPDPVTVAVPLQVPLQVAAVPLVVLVRRGGWVTINAFVAMQPLASVIVILNVPAHKPVAVAVIWEAGSFQR